jgi:hypothetical protein
MFRKLVRRFNLGALLVVALGVVVLSGAGGSFAGLPSLPNPVSYPSTDPDGHQCPGFAFSERHYCLVVTTQSGLARSGAIEVDLTMQNYDTGTLNKPAAGLTWSPSSANLTFISSSPSSCSYPSSDGGVACTFPDIPGEGSASGGDNPPHHDATVKVFFTVNAPADLLAVTFTAKGTAKERSNDNGGAANVEQQTAIAPMSFGTDPNSLATVALPDRNSSLNASLDASSVGFAVPKGTSPFIAKFAADPSTTACFGGITCSGLLLTTDLSGAPISTFSANNQILWKAVINSNSTNVDAIHYYDPVAVTASPTTKTFTSTTSFASCDGVNFATAPTGLQANQDYFVVKGTATATSFQVSTSATGKPLSFTDSGQFMASCIRVIGDDPSERIKSCTAASDPPAPKVPPGICAAKVDASKVKVYLWDSSNGGVHI